MSYRLGYYQVGWKTWRQATPVFLKSQGPENTIAETSNHLSETRNSSAIFTRKGAIDTDPKYALHLKNNRFAIVDRQDTPNRLPLPPILLVTILLGAFLTHLISPWGWGTSQLAGLGSNIGLLLILMAFGLDIWAFKTFQRHQTTIMPNKGASSLATDGPFRFSRNPIYLGNVILAIGGGLVFSSYWFFVGAVILFIALRELAIKPEEEHLAHNFPETWNAYKAKTRRWL